MGLTKADLADLIHEYLNRGNNYSKKECLDLVDQVFEVTKRAIVDEGKLKLSGFGNFEVKQKRTRKGRNPQTGAEMPVEARRVVTFKASPLLKTRVDLGPA
jgi:integration host factor subunit alpha